MVVRLGNGNPFLRRSRDEHVVPVMLEYRRTQLPELWIIFNQKKGLCSSRDAGRLFLGSSILGGLIDTRKVDLERRALIRLTVHPNVAAALFYDAVHHRKSKPRALSHFLGCIE